MTLLPFGRLVLSCGEKIIALAAVTGILDVCSTWGIPMSAKPVSNVVRCLRLVMFIVMCITNARTEAASYEKTDGNIVDPIRLIRGGFVHSCSGANLKRYAEIPM